MKLKAIIISVILLTGYSKVFSQIFNEIDSLKLKADEITYGHWVDLDNDNFLDYIAVVKIDANTLQPLFLKFIDGKISVDTLKIDVLAEASFFVQDFNSDNRMDIAFSGRENGEYVFKIFNNDGNLSFVEDDFTMDSIYATDIVMVDLNQNGARELLLNGVNKDGDLVVATYQLIDNKWEAFDNDFEAVEQGKILAMDYNNDGWKDLIFQGKDENAVDIINLWENIGDLLFDTVTTSFVNLKGGDIKYGDINSDGFFDIIISGVDDNDIETTKYYENIDGLFTEVDLSLDQIVNAKIFIADLNSDGHTDIALKGSDGGVLINKMWLNDGNQFFTKSTLPNPRASLQDFGDYDFDGDLDMIQSMQTGDSIKFILLENATLAINEGPTTPTGQVAIPFFDNVNLRWNLATDDHSDPLAITYDLYIRTDNGLFLSPSFDMPVDERLIVAHGNQQTLTNASYYNLPAGVYYYGIHSVDNAFHSEEGALCSGIGGQLENAFVICDEPNLKELTVCAGDIVTLVADSHKIGEWFSSQNGYLGAQDSLEIVIEQSDSIFFAVQNSVQCSEYQMWSINVSDGGSIGDFSDLWVCLNDTITLNVENQWDTVRWHSITKGLLSDSSSLEYIINQNETLIVERISKLGCVFSDTFNVNISMPEIGLNGKVFRITLGGSVQLEASGGATYSWSPVKGLDNAVISNPVASPITTATYSVVMMDSIGCTVSDEVNIIVDDRAFIPTLFTPNGDNINERLKVYGLNNVTSVKFRITNRSGNVVYKSRNINEMSVSGWDGSTNGKEQPNGIYYWKILGENNNGTKVEIGDQTTGVIHLLR